MTSGLTLNGPLWFSLILFLGALSAHPSQRAVQFWPGDSCGTISSYKGKLKQIDGPRPIGDDAGSLGCQLVSYIVTQGKYCASRQAVLGM